MFGIIGTTILFVGAFFFISHLNRKNGGKMTNASDDWGNPGVGIYSSGNVKPSHDKGSVDPFDN